MTDAPDSLAVVISLGVLGTISVGTLVLLQVQALKLLVPALTGQIATVAVLACSLLAQLMAFVSLGVDWGDAYTIPALYVSTLGTFVSAVAQYAFLFKVSVKGLPPTPNASVDVADVSQNDGDDATQITSEHELTPKIVPPRDRLPDS